MHRVSADERFVPNELKDQASPCRLIPFTDKGETIDYFYRCGTQLELEETLAGWLRKQVSRIEEQREAAPEAEHSSGIDPLRRQQWLGLAGNLYSLANFHRENHNHVVHSSRKRREMDFPNLEVFSYEKTLPFSIVTTRRAEDTHRSKAKLKSAVVHTNAMSNAAEWTETR